LLIINPSRLESWILRAVLQVLLLLLLLLLLHSESLLRVLRPTVSHCALLSRVNLHATGFVGGHHSLPCRLPPAGVARHGRLWHRILSALGTCVRQCWILTQLLHLRSQSCLSLLVSTVCSHWESLFGLLSIYFSRGRA
jgi:hypothetical protein